MNIQKLIAIVAAIAINCVVLAWFHAVGVRAVANASPRPGLSQTVVTLPTITVRPTRVQIESLRAGTTARRAGADAGHATPAADGDARALAMPFYSFADESGAAVGG